MSHDGWAGATLAGCRRHRGKQSLKTELPARKGPARGAAGDSSPRRECHCSASNPAPGLAAPQGTWMDLPALGRPSLGRCHSRLGSKATYGGPPSPTPNVPPFNSLTLKKSSWKSSHREAAQARRLAQGAALKNPGLSCLLLQDRGPCSPQGTLGGLPGSRLLLASPTVVPSARHSNKQAPSTHFSIFKSITNNKTLFIINFKQLLMDFKFCSDGHRCEGPVRVDRPAGMQWIQPAPCAKPCQTRPARRGRGGEQHPSLLGRERRASTGPPAADTELNPQQGRLALPWSQRTPSRCWPVVWLYT